jgi:plastocyanin
MRRTVAVLLAGTGLLTVPASAWADRYTSYAGPPAPPPKGAPKDATLNRFFPAALHVRAGDSVRYRISFVHTITKLAKGAQLPPAALPDPTGGVYSGFTDPLGQPFFFNGLPKFINNPAVFTRGGKPVVRGQKSAYNSGFVVGGPNVSRTVRFAKRGTYQILCQLHPGMHQTVVVGRSHGRADTRAQVRKAVAKQAAAGWRRVTRASKKAVAPNTVMAGVGDQDTVIGYRPSRLSVKAGTTVRFVEGSRSEIHNMIFGDRAYAVNFLAANEKLPLSPGAPSQVAPPSIYGSDPVAPGAPYVHTGTNHGNGFLWTPIMDRFPGDPPAGLPGSESITFTAPGTYRYFCAVHGESMRGEVVVTP